MSHDRYILKKSTHEDVVGAFARSDRGAGGAVDGGGYPDGGGYGDRYGQCLRDGDVGEAFQASRRGGGMGPVRSLSAER